MKSIAILSIFICMGSGAWGKTAKVLFIGNSYTYVNDLPLLISDMASTTGDTLIYDFNTPGSYTLSAHCSNSVTLNKIKAGGWDYVVLQEQSQLPSLSQPEVEQYTLPYARKLDSLIHVYSPCAETIFYMTWGRKNGDQDNCPTWPYVCTYAGMDSLLHARYMLMADSNHASVSPVGAAWHYVRDHYPAIELYQADESHPSPEGTYVAGCSFYTAIFKKPADSVTYNFSLNPTDAANIRDAATKVVYDSMSHWHIGAHEVYAAFQHTLTAKTVTFSNTSMNAVQYHWDFGDGQTSTAAAPAHTYTQFGNYTVTLIVTGVKGCSDTTVKTVGVWMERIEDVQDHVAIIIAPNPAHNLLHIASVRPGTHAYHVRILNSIGQVVCNTSVSSAQNTDIDISHLNTGVYILHIDEGQHSVYRGTFIKE